MLRLSRLFLPLLAVLPMLLGSFAEARPKATAFYEWGVLDPAIAPGTLLRYQDMALPPFYRARAWRILYMTRDYAGRPIVSSGIVLLSLYAAKNPQQRTIVAWAHPTTGVARKCAPSLRQRPTDAIEGINELIAAGQIVTATDYPGLGTDGPTGYLVGPGQARAVIDSVRAARQIPGVGGGRRYAVWGYSQGGHAALFAARISRSYAPELSLVGAAAVAPPTLLADLLRATIDTIPGRILAALTLGSWSVKYAAPLGSLVDPAAAKVVAAVGNTCLDDLGGKLDALAAQKPLAQNFLRRDPARTAPWSRYMADNSISVLPASTPLFIAQGTADSIVRPDVTLKFVRAQCRAGSPVAFLPIKGADHGTSVKRARKPAAAWINARFSTTPPPNDCR